MSLIDEALRRTRQKSGESAPIESSQETFIPAWRVSEEESGAPSDAGARHLGRKLAPGEAAISFSSKWKERLAGGPDGNPVLIEQFRRLAATLHHAKQNHNLCSVMVTSAAPGDGKTLTAVNLALVLSESYGYDVLLVDADLRRPSIPDVLDLTDGSGLSDALRAPTDQKLALVPITSRLTVLPAGQAISNSVEALTSPRMRQILQEAVARFDWVLLDAPPVGPTVDARLLTQMVGGTLFVIHAGKTQSPEVLKAVDAIGRDQILGVVLNGVIDDKSEPYYAPLKTKG